MKFRVTICLFLLALLPATAMAGDLAFTVRATELKKEPYIDRRDRRYPARSGAGGNPAPPRRLDQIKTQSTTKAG